MRGQVASLAAKAAWSMQAWDRLESYVNILDPHKPDGAFLRCLVALQKGRYEEAQECVNTTRYLGSLRSFLISRRDILSAQLPALVGESYQRAYEVLVSVQELAEIEDIIELKTSKSFSFKSRVTWGSGERQRRKEECYYKYLDCKT